MNEIIPMVVGLVAGWLFASYVIIPLFTKGKDRD